MLKSIILILICLNSFSQNDSVKLKTHSSLGFNVPFNVDIAKKPFDYSRKYQYTIGISLSYSMDLFTYNKLRKSLSKSSYVIKLSYYAYRYELNYISTSEYGSEMAYGFDAIYGFGISVGRKIVLYPQTTYNNICINLLLGYDNANYTKEVRTESSGERAGRFTANIPCISIESGLIYQMKRVSFGFQYNLKNYSKYSIYGRIIREASLYHLASFSLAFKLGKKRPN